MVLSICSWPPLLCVWTENLGTLRSIQNIKMKIFRQEIRQKCTPGYQPGYHRFGNVCELLNNVTSQGLNHMSKTISSLVWQCLCLSLSRYVLACLSVSVWCCVSWVCIVWGTTAGHRLPNTEVQWDCQHGRLKFELKVSYVEWRRCFIWWMYSLFLSFLRIISVSIAEPYKALFE